MLFWVWASIYSIYPHLLHGLAPSLASKLILDIHDSLFLPWVRDGCRIHGRRYLLPSILASINLIRHKPWIYRPYSCAKTGSQHPQLKTRKKQKKKKKSKMDNSEDHRRSSLGSSKSPKSRAVFGVSRNKVQLLGLLVKCKVHTFETRL